MIRYPIRKGARHLGKVTGEVSRRGNTKGISRKYIDSANKKNYPDVDQQDNRCELVLLVPIRDHGDV